MIFNNAHCDILRMSAGAGGLGGHKTLETLLVGIYMQIEDLTQSADPATPWGDSAPSTWRASIEGASLDALMELEADLKSLIIEVREYRDARGHYSPVKDWQQKRFVIEDINRGAVVAPNMTLSLKPTK